MKKIGASRAKQGKISRAGVAGQGRIAALIDGETVGRRSKQTGVMRRVVLDYDEEGGGRIKNRQVLATNAHKLVPPIMAAAAKFMTTKSPEEAAVVALEAVVALLTTIVFELPDATLSPFDIAILMSLLPPEGGKESNKSSAVLAREMRTTRTVVAEALGRLEKLGAVKKSGSGPKDQTWTLIETIRYKDPKK